MLCADQQSTCGRITASMLYSWQSWYSCIVFFDSFEHMTAWLTGCKWTGERTSHEPRTAPIAAPTANPVLVALSTRSPYGMPCFCKARAWLDFTCYSCIRNSRCASHRSARQARTVAAMKRLRQESKPRRQDHELDISDAVHTRQPKTAAVPIGAEGRAHIWQHAASSSSPRSTTLRRKPSYTEGPECRTPIISAARLSTEGFSQPVLDRVAATFEAIRVLETCKSHAGHSRR